ncbi:MAG TPA: calcium-binding protein [Rhodospirillaceae bacterium]|jgi:predicted lipid-binding transport protein (Tim44 family)|nr:calcium-binding protein [Rhodospirillaceae bacterium]MAX63662.1 calcium-binding protein [Rhodospirillaceae bacterium]MBB56640.1 calcium-binding protein [Rhodospirillaceae bacterium]HAE01226.1 calcium-binding protein [Rhodospirillaceae bacterium]HAJ20977.1 calcium-binding protein [Rhodospirillaceae bacterium]|tara:strand:- start:33969 stop:34652 length:684 start_codon:yes stop_codon:yes gene_type:complete
MPFDLLIFAAIALFLIFRLGSVLGKRTGHQKPPEFPQNMDNARPETRDRSGERDDNVVRMPAGFEDPVEESAHFNGPAGDGLRDIAQADPNFDPDSFVQGAAMAFEMIVTAYAEGDRKALKPLLDKVTYDSFAGAIDAREKAGQRMEDTLVGIDSTTILEAGMHGDDARVTLRFVSQQVNVTYDSEGRVQEGDPSTVETVSDVWTFARSVKSKDPNWQLVETRTTAE